MSGLAIHEGITPKRFQTADLDFQMKTNKFNRPKTCKYVEVRERESQFVQFDPRFRYTKMLKNSQTLQRHSVWESKRNYKKSEEKASINKFHQKYVQKHSQAKKNRADLRNKRNATFSARQAKRQQVLGRIQNMRKSLEIKERNKFRKNFKQAIKEKDQAEQEKNQVCYDTSRTHTKKIDEVKIRQKEAEKEKIRIKMEHREMDDSIRKAQEINFELRKRAKKAKKSQKERIIQRRLRETRSAEPNDPFSNNYNLRQVASSKELRLRQKQSQMVNHLLEISKKVRQIKREKNEYMEQKRCESANKQLRALGIRKENDKNKKAFIQKARLSLMKKFERVNKSSDRAIDENINIFGKNLSKKAINHTVNSQSQSVPSVHCHKLPKKQALVLIKKEKKEKQRKQDLIDSIMEKNHRAEKIRNLKKKYIAKVSRENHKIFERTNTSGQKHRVRQSDTITLSNIDPDMK